MDCLGDHVPYESSGGVKSRRFFFWWSVKCSWICGRAWRTKSLGVRPTFWNFNQQNLEDFYICSCHVRFNHQKSGGSFSPSWSINLFRPPWADDTFMGVNQNVFSWNWSWYTVYIGARFISIMCTYWKNDNILSKNSVKNVRVRKDESLHGQHLAERWWSRDISRSIKARTSTWWIFP